MRKMPICDLVLIVNILTYSTSSQRVISRVFHLQLIYDGVKTELVPVTVK